MLFDMKLLFTAFSTCYGDVYITPINLSSAVTKMVIVIYYVVVIDFYSGSHRDYPKQSIISSQLVRLCSCFSKTNHEIPFTSGAYLSDMN